MANSSILVLLIAISYALVTIPIRKQSKEGLIIGAWSYNATSYLKNYANIQYYAQIYAGSPPQLFNVQVSTASPWLWIPSKKCQFSCHKSSNYFDPFQSSTYKLLGENYKVTYGMGFIQGDLASESFSIGDNNALFIKGQAFLLIHQDGGFNGALYDGILGLEYGGTSFGYPNFLDNLLIQGQIARRMFSVYLGDNDFLGNYYDGSAVIFGGYDLETYANSPEIKYANLYQINGKWQVQLSNLRVNNYPVSSNSFQAYFDVGTTLIYAPQAEFNSIINKIAMAGQCGIQDNWLVCDCGTYYDINNYPSISFVLGSAHSFSLEPQNYFYKYGTSCYLLFAINPSNAWFIGDVFMRKYYTIFDADYARIGFALAKTKKFTKLSSFLGADVSGIDGGRIEDQEKLEPQKGFQISTILFYVLISGILLGLLSGFIYLFCNNQKGNYQGFHYEKIRA
ncbi:unnamed protein product [Blepharisma stoltei]|uniref:Peptidase A1 domain-containing protein n=1 Tax=Blepharisma stoltei TaxID=1481888 RepID=A0AAU9JLK6_9CILI|nr:unnamed protein product [Blepharisma stoltei]